LARSENGFLQWEQMILIRSVIKILPVLAALATLNDADKLLIFGPRHWSELTDRGHKSSMDLASSQADWRKLDHPEITRHRDPGMARNGGDAPQQQISFTGNRPTRPGNEKPAGVNRRAALRPLARRSTDRGCCLEPCPEDHRSRPAFAEP
jgi:hypothetical protein